MEEPLSTEERKILLGLARQAIEAAAHKRVPASIDLNELPERLREPGVTFVTLTSYGMLRGCIGALEAYQPLAEDVREHAVAAATQDFRFPPVSPDEVPGIQIEISRLTAPQPLEYEAPEQLPERLRPHIDGVILRDGFRRATFLPQVWDKLPQPEQFLDHLCQKMGAPPDHWRRRMLDVQIYQVEEFHE